MVEVRPVDVMVLTALEIEHAAVHERLRIVEEHWHHGTLFEVGTAGDLRIGLVATGPGNVDAAILAERAIELLTPRALLVVGIAGALSPDLAPGDVVVGTKIYGYHGGREDDHGFSSRPEAWYPAHALEQRARQLSRQERWRGRVHFRPIAAGEVVVEGSLGPVAQLLRERYDDAAAIETGSSGVGAAVRFNDGRGALVVRAISDDADRGAAEQAAAFALELAPGLAAAVAAPAAPAASPPPSAHQSITSYGSGAAFGVINGNVHFHDHRDE